MCYVEPTKEIAKLEKIVAPYLARNKAEDRGDKFKEGTPDDIVAMRRRIKDYYRTKIYSPNGVMMHM